MVIRKFKTQHFTVIVDTLPEHDLDLSWDDDGSTAKGLNNGSLVAFVARARVLGPSGMELASDYLGECIYESPEAFEDHRECGRYNRELEAYGAVGRCGSYFADMVSNVCSEARKEWLKLQNEVSSIRLRS